MKLLNILFLKIIVFEFKLPRSVVTILLFLQILKLSKYFLRFFRVRSYFFIKSADKSDRPIVTLFIKFLLLPIISLWLSTPSLSRMLLILQKRFSFKSNFFTQ